MCFRKLTKIITPTQFLEIFIQALLANTQAIVLETCFAFTLGNSMTWLRETNCNISKAFLITMSAAFYTCFGSYFILQAL